MLAAICLAATAWGLAQPARAQTHYEHEEPYNRYVHKHGVTNQFSLHMLVPVWLSETGVDPGFGMEGRLGWELGGFTPEFYFGGMVNWVDVAYDGWSSPSEPLDSFWLGFGARYHLYNPTAFVPFVGLGLQANFWNAMLEDGHWVYDGRRRPTIGLRASFGAAVELSANFAVELGVHGILAHPGSVFDHRPLYLSPFAGGTFYF